MEEAKKAEVNTKEKKKFSMKIVVVLLALVVFGLVTTISLRAEYLNISGIGEEYLSVFEQRIKNKYTVFGTAFVLIYIFVYILNKFIKRGLKKFFEDEKKEMPAKLPNKSLSLILALIGGAIAAAMLTDKLAIITNAALFGQSDPIFGADIGYYMFAIPFIQTMLIFLMEVFLVAIIYTGLYYVITLNTFFDGVDVETLKKNTFVKQEIFIFVLLAIVFCVYVFISAQNILTGNMLTIADEAETMLIGAGKADVTIKLWGYRILTFVVAAALIRLLIYIKKQNFKQSVISVMIVPAYLFCMFLVMVYFQTIHIGNNELDNEKEFIGYNIRNTKAAYGIEIDQQNINSYSAITSEQASKYDDVIDNIPLITEEVTLNAVKEHQENSVYYNYENTFLATYKVDGKDKLMYITPREILNDSTISYNNRTLKYTHGYSVVATSAVDGDSDGYAEYILSDFTNHEKLNIKEPRIYFGLETNSTIMTNTKFGKEYDYPITASKNEENIYAGKAGLKLGFLDRLVLAITERNFKLVFSSDITENTKLINNRNIIERAKKLLPDVLYDENPYLVINGEGRLVWVLDGYTRSNSYPYSQTTTINIKGYKEKLNYIRNSVKVLIDAYDGTTKFYITDNTDPVIMTYRNIYPDLFIEEGIPEDVKEHLVYPKFLYEIQADMINTYHDISEDTLYRADDIWQITPKASQTKSTVVGVEMEPYYTMVKTIDTNGSKLGLFLTYNKYGKQNITSYLVGTVKNGKLNLSLYKFNLESNVAGIMQLNNQIEQDAAITKQLEDINTSGTRLIKDMIIVPIDNTLLYVEPIYQVMLNDDSQIPILKKVIVASGNIVAIGDSLEKAISNLFNDDYAVDLEFINIEDISALVDSVIKANNNLKDSLNASDFEMIGKDISTLQARINQLETARKNELERLAEQERLNKDDENEDNENVVENEVLENEVETSKVRSTNEISNTH